MDNVLVDMVQRLRAIELLLRTQNEVLIRVLAELEQIRRHTNASGLGERADESPLRKRA
jgi:hypothetical protein